MIPVDGATLAALAAGNVRLALFIELQLDGPVYVRYTTAGIDLTWASPTTGLSATWNGKGAVLGIEAAEESLGLAADLWRILLSGTQSDTIALFLANRVRGRPARAWVGVYDDAGALVATPFKRLDGQMNSFVLEDDPKQSRGVLTVQSRLAAMLRAPNTYWTNADQKKLYPTDDGLKFAETTAARSEGWGPRR